MINNELKSSISNQAASPNAEEILSYLIESGMVDLGGVKESMKKSRRQAIIDNYIDKVKKLNGKTDKRYYIRMKDPSKKDGRTTLKAPTKEELLDKIYEWHIEHVDPYSKRIDKDKITLSDLYPEFLEYKKATTWSAATVKRNLSVWENYYDGTEIINTPLCKIKLKDLEMWAYQLIKDNNLTLTEFRNKSTWMKQMFEYAEREELIEKNTYRLLKINNRNVFREPATKHDENMVLAPEDELLIYKECMRLFTNGYYKVNRYASLAIILLFQFGARPCEMVPLKFSDINDGSIIISRLYSEKGNAVINNHTKAGHGARTIPLTPLAKSVLSIIQSDKELSSESDYIFINEEKQMYSFYYRIGKTFPKICSRLGIPRNTPYSGRRTFISSLIDANVNIKTIMELVGHNEAKTTYGNYVYDRTNRKKRADQIINARLAVNIEDIVPSVPSR